MENPLPTLHLIRHGETLWSLSGQHTSLTDLALTTRGREQALRLAARLSGRRFALVLTSPLLRAEQTCQLAGFGGQAERDPDLVEWNYGAYEGLRSTEIRVTQPSWQLFRDGAPGGEAVADVSARADRVLARVRAVGGDALLFSSGHFSRVLAARWLGLSADHGRHLLLYPAALSELTYEHSLGEPAIRLWNDTSHLRG
jgi:broad specificity phosphatase PhoE